MNKGYELMVVLKPGLGEEAYKKNQENFKNWITKTGGEILLLKPWGLRELSTPFKKQSQGYYLQIQFNRGKTTLSELESRMRVDETIIRSLVVTLDSVNPELTGVVEISESRQDKPKRAPRKEKVAQPQV